MDIEDFVAVALQRVGGVAEPAAGDRLDVLLPPAVAASLELAEEARLRLRGQPLPQEAYAGYGSDLLSRICSVAAGTGRRFRLELDLPLPKQTRVRREAVEALRFRNGVGHVVSVEPATLDYAMFDFRYAALSEDRLEGLVSVAITAGGACSPGLATDLPACLSAHPEARRAWSNDREDGLAAQLYPAARSLALRRAREEIRPFVSRMERRLRRDLRRIGDYYRALQEEAGRRRGRGSPEGVRDKLAAIDAEHLRRGRDARRRYAVQVRVEPLGLLVVRVTGLILHARLRRRKARADVRLAWNPVARRFDCWLCAGCGDEARVPFLCDRMHLLCAACPPRCPGCGSNSCPACGERRCRC